MAKLLHYPIILLALMAAPALVVADTASPTTLQQVLVAGLNTNPSLMEAVARARAAEDRAKQQRALLLPDVRAQSSWSVEQRDLPGRVETRHPFANSLALTQPLTMTDEWLTWRAAAAQAEAAAANAKITAQDLQLALTTAYLDVQVAQETVDGLDHLAQLLAKQHKANHRLFELGEGTKTGVALAAARLAEARASLQRSLAERDADRSHLVALAGLPLTTLVWPTPRKLFRPVGLATALNHHPRMREAEASLATAQYQRKTAATSLFPEVSLNATTGRTADDFNGGHGEWANRLTVTVSYPLFQGGRTAYGLRAAINDEEAARQSLERTSREVTAEIEAALSNWRNSATAYIEAETAWWHQQTAIKGARFEYQQGERSLTDLLDAEQEFAQTRINLARAKREALLSVERLRAAEGTLVFP